MISVLLMMIKMTVDTVVETKHTMFEFALFFCKETVLPVAVSIQENTVLVHLT